jgi:hypothetical protein
LPPAPIHSPLSLLSSFPASLGIFFTLHSQDSTPIHGCWATALRAREESERSLLSLILPQYAEMANSGGHSDAEEQLLTEYESYLFSLSSAAFQQLMKEPEKLHDEAEKMKKQMQDLAFTHYKAFIQTSECIRGMKQQVPFSHHLILIHNK